MASLGEPVRLERGKPHAETLSVECNLTLMLRRLYKSRFLLLTSRCHFMKWISAVADSELAPIHCIKSFIILNKYRDVYENV